MFTFDELDAARSIVQALVPPTPAYAWPLLARRVGAEVIVKHENHTPTGSFKARGGLVYVEMLKREGRLPSGLITATRGNHGQSVAIAGKRAGIPVLIVVPDGNSAEKNAAMEAFGGELMVAGRDFDEARVIAAELARDRGFHFVPSFHRSLVMGVATYAMELLTSFTELHRVYVPIGMGSGICAMIVVRDLLGLSTEIVGVVADTKYENQREEIQPLLYTPWRQEGAAIGEMHFVLRTAGEPMTLANTVRQVVHELDSNLPVTELGTQRFT